MTFAASVGMLCAASCASLPDFRKVEATTDRMAAYAGVMAANMPVAAQSVNRISETMERMERKAARTADAMSGATPKVESYVKSFIDNRGATARSLEEIRRELADLKTKMRRPAPHSQAPTQAGDERQVQARIMKLEEELDRILWRQRNRSN